MKENIYYLLFIRDSEQRPLKSWITQDLENFASYVSTYVATAPAGSQGVIYTLNLTDYVRPACSLVSTFGAHWR